MMKKNLFYNSLLSISQFIFPLITFPYSSRILGPKGIGSVNFIDSFTQYFILFAALGIPLYGVREISKQKKEQDLLDKTFNEIFLIHLISSLIFATVYFITALLTPALRVHLDLVFVGIIILFFNVLSAEWFFQGIEQFAYITARTLIVRCISVVFLFAFLKSDSHPIVYYSISATGYVINGILNMFYLRKHVKIKFTALEMRRHVKPLVVILSSTLAVSVYLLMDTIMLGFFKGEVAVGIYSTALRLAKIPFAVVGAMSAVIIPQVSQAFYNNDHGLIASLINKSLSFICIAGLPIAIGLYVSSAFLVNGFAGNRFDEAILALKLLSPAIVVMGLSNVFAVQLLTPLGKESYLFRAVVIGMVFSLVANFILIPIFSYNGAAITSILTECVVTLLSFYFVQKFIVIKYEFRIFFQSLFGALMFIPIAYLIRMIHISQDYKEIAVILSCIIFYLLYLWLAVKNVYIENIKLTILEKLKLSIFQKAGI